MLQETTTASDDHAGGFYYHVDHYYPYRRPYEAPCPSCGYCPTCGRRRGGHYWYPYTSGPDLTWCGSNDAGGFPDEVTITCECQN